MVEADRADGIETPKIVAIGRVVAVPGDHIERRVIDRCPPQRPLELGDQLELPFAVLVACLRGFEVARIGEAIGADRPEIR